MKVKILRHLALLLVLSAAVPAATGIVRGDEPPARPLSEIYCGVTLEWLADSCPYIGIYTAETVQPDFSGHVWVGASLTETLRGKPPEKASFDDPGFHEPGTNSAFADVGDRYLLFLRDERASDGKSDIREEHIIRLKRPNTKGWNQAAIRPDFSVLTDGKQVEKMVRDRISKVAVTPFPWMKRPTDRRRVEVPRDTPAFKALWDGENRVFLIVPDDLLPVTTEEEKNWGKPSGGLQCRLTPAKQTVTVKPDQDASDVSIHLSFELRNVGGCDVRLLPWYTPIPLGGYGYPMFEVIGQDGKEVEYAGPRMDRPPATPRDYIKIPRGVKLTRRFQLPYDLTKPGPYQVTFRMLMESRPDDWYYEGDIEKAKKNPDNVWAGELMSNTVTVQITRAVEATSPRFR